MTPERWQQIEDVFQAVIDLAPAERLPYLKENHSHDDDLIAEVERLIADYEEAGDFIESPVWTDSFMLGSTVRGEIGEALDEEIKKDNGTMIGKRLGVYRLTRELGRGGMGAVYLAERADGEFRQRVALKVIKRGMDTDFIVRRFRNERQILATLDHPNIARLLDGGTTDDGLPFFVMEYIEGKPVYKYSDSEKLTINERLQLFRRICGAVDYAHRNHIIHRDIKPSNILITANGTPKLLDFGIAKILDPELAADSIDPTATAMRMMTPEYASPEQVRGEPVTKASDIYSLGVLLFELLTGHRPYRLRNRALHEIARVICEEEPDHLSASLTREDNIVPTNGGEPHTLEYIFQNRSASRESLRRELSGDVEKIVRKALRKEPSERYQTASEFAEDIGRHLENRPVLAETFYLTPPKPVKTPAKPRKDEISVAVLPLKLFGSPAPGAETGDDYLCIGLADALITRLSNVRRFIVRPTSSVLRYGNTESEPITAGEELGVNYVVDGNIRRVGSKLRVTVQLLNINEGAARWAGKFDEEFTDVLSLEDTISEQIAEALLPQLSGDEREKLKKRGTDSPQAFEHYLRGRYYWNGFTEDGFAKAINAYRQAVEFDPHYALAYAGIADYYNWLGVYGVMPSREAFDAAIEAGEKAVALDAELAEAHAALGFARHGGRFEWEASEEHFQKALQINQNTAVTHVWYAIKLTTEGRFAEGLRHARRGIELDPNTPFYQHNLGWCLYFARQFEQSLRQYRHAAELFPDYPLAHYGLAYVQRYLGRYGEALGAAARVRELMNESVFSLLLEAQTFAAAGMRREAEEALRKLEQPSANQLVSSYHTALVYAFLDEAENVYRLLEKCLEASEAWLVWLGVEPAFDNLRSSARFKEILEKTRNPIVRQRAFATHEKSNPSLAVLPFKLMNVAADADTEDKFLGVGLADALITRLSNVRRFTVRPTSSVLRFGADHNAFEAGEELGVDFVVDGNIRRVGDVLRVTVQLLNTEEGATRWARRFDEKIADVLTLEDSISGQIAKALSLQLSGEEEQQIGKRGTNSTEAHEAYLRGRYYWNLFTPEGLQKAFESFKAAVSIDPNYGLAHVGLADFYTWANIYGLVPSLEALQKAEEYARRAIEIDNQLGAAYATFGLIMQNRKQWTEAQLLKRQAIKLSPNYVHAYEWGAAQLIGFGQTEEGLAEMRVAEKLDPLSLRTKTLAAWTFYQAHYFEEALERGRSIVELDKNYPQGYSQIGLALYGAGRFAEALPYFQKFDEMIPGSALAKYQLCFALVGAGRRNEARRVLEEIKRTAEASFVKPYFLGMAYAALDMRDEAFACFERSFAEDEPWMLWLATEPMLKNLHGDARYYNLLRRMKNPLAERFAVFEKPSERAEDTAAGKSIAVLPFKVLNTATGNLQDNEFLGIGLADALVTRLSSVRRLIVRPTSSVIRYGAQPTVDPFAAAAEIDVEFVVDGSVKRAADRIRVSVQLLDVAGKTTIWAQSFDENFTDVLELEDSISEQVAGALVSTLTGEERERIENRGTKNAQAYEAYLKGRFNWHTFTVDGMAKALICFYESIALDPNFAAAYCGVADYYNFLSIFGIMSPQETFPAAKQAAQKAVESDPHLHEAYISLGIIAFGYDWDFAEAERFLRRAVELSPNSAEAHTWLGSQLSLAGNHEPAVREMQRAEKLNPRSPQLLTQFAIVLRNARRFEEGLDKIRKALEIQPNNPTALASYCWFVRDLENYDEAERMCLRALEVSDRQNLPLYAYGYTLAVAGKRDEARQVLKELKARRAKQYVPPVFIVLICTALGDLDEAFRWLGKSFDEHDFWAVWLAVDPRFDPLKADVRYNYYVEKIRPWTPEEEQIHESYIATKILPDAGSAEISAPIEETKETQPAEETTAAEESRPGAVKKLVAYAGGALVLLIAAFLGYQAMMRTGEKPVISVDPQAKTSYNVSDPQIKKIAVLPFKTDAHGEKEKELGLGLAESLYRKLGQITQLSVRPAMLNLPQEQTPKELGASFGVNFILRGSLHHEGDQLRVSVELVDTNTEKILWAETFDENISSFPDLQVSIADKVLKVLTIELTARERQQINKSYTKNSEAYQIYLAGRYLMANRSAENLNKAIRTFEKARETDPTFVLAYAGLADAYALLNLYQMPPPDDAYPKAKENALRALEFDPDLPEAHAALGYILFYGERRRAEAQIELRRALELNPSYTTAYHWSGLIYAAMGKSEESIGFINKAMELEPRSAIVHSAAGLVYFYARRYDEALEFCRKALELNAGLVPAHKTMRYIYEAAGNGEQARAAYRKERLFAVSTDEADPNWLMITAQVEAVEGKHEEARSSIKRAVEAPSVKNNPRAYADEIALAYAFLGDREAALEWIKKAREANAHGFNFAAIDPRFDRIKDERFIEATRIAE